MKEINSAGPMAVEEVGICLTYFREQTLFKGFAH